MRTDDLLSVARRNGIEMPPSRLLRAVGESMSVLDNGDGTVDVVSESGHYSVDPRAKTCTCPDAQERGSECKHQRRVALETGRAEPAEWNAELGGAALEVDDEIEELAERMRELKTARRELGRLVDDIDEMAGKASAIGPAEVVDTEQTNQSRPQDSRGVASGD